MKKQVICYGEILWDTFGDEQVPGGAPLNVALHLQQQGIKSQLVSRVGNDALGEQLVAFLTEHRLYSPLIQHDDKLPTCVVTVELDASHQATYTIPQPVSWDNIKAEDELTERIKHTDVIVFGSLACRGDVSRNTLQDLFEQPMLKVFDVNLREPQYDLDTVETLAAFANVIKMNEDEAKMLIGGSTSGSIKDHIVEFQHKFHCQTICVTRGENGAMVWHQDKFYEHPGFEVQVKDTVGAGDAFLATLIAGLLNANPMNQILEKACAVGALVTAHRGANPIYSHADIDALVKQGRQVVI
jgi:fructokinase